MPVRSSTHPRPRLLLLCMPAAVRARIGCARPVPCAPAAAFASCLPIARVRCACAVNSTVTGTAQWVHDTRERCASKHGMC
jgi:hypothetical protein